MPSLAQALLAFRTRGFVAFSQDVTSSQTVNWPSGANTATIECYGAGGGGGAGTGNPAEGGGGRGGGYSSVTVTKGAETGLVVTIGAAGAAGITGSINGGPGGTSSVSQNGSTVCLATGGDGGTGASANNGNGTGATTSNGTAVGTVTRNGGIMNKREQIRWIKRVFQYLQTESTIAYENKDEQNFDWYSDGQQALFCLIQGRPIVISKRIRPL